MDSVYISGRFITKDGKAVVEGPIEFVPSRMWVEDNDGIAWATLAPATITKNGRFRVQLTACHKVNGVYGWFYQIRCPMGIWSFHPDGYDGEEIQLKDLIPTRH